MNDIINGSIYQWKNLVNRKCYIGQALRSAEARRKGHITESKRVKPRSAIARAIKKHGLENFEFYVIHEGITDWRTLNELEIALIAEYDSYQNGYNDHKGGQAEFRLHKAREYREDIAYTYITEPKSGDDLAKEYGTSDSVIYSILESLDIPRKQNGWWLKDQPACNRHEVWEHDKEVAYIYVRHRISAYQIAKHFGTCPATIYRILDDMKIPRRNNGWWMAGKPSPNRDPAWEHAEKIASMYQDEKRSAYDLAEKFKTTVRVIYNILDSMDIPRRTHQREDVWEHEEDIECMYDIERETLTAIAICFDTNPTTISRILLKRGVTLRGKKTEAWESAEEIVYMYEEREWSAPQIATEFGVVKQTIYTILHKMGVTLRTGRQSQLIRKRREAAQQHFC